MKTSLTFRYLALFIMLVLTSFFSIQVIQHDQAYLYDENQLMEYVQIFLLLVTGTVFWLTAAERNWNIVKASFACLSLLAYLGAALSFSFILREMSIKQSHIDWLIFFVDGQGFKIIMAMVWLPLLYKAFQFRNEYIEIVKKSILSPTALFLMAAVVFLASGGLFDKEIIVVEYFRFYEEILEMNGYGFMLLAALSFRRDMVLAVCNREKSALRSLDNNELDNNTLAIILKSAVTTNIR
jgi:hypothetical protein